MSADIDREAEIIKFEATSLYVVPPNSREYDGITQARLDGWLAAKEDSARAAIPPSTAPQMTPAMRSVAGAMANVLYNFGQHARRTFTDEEARLFADLAKQWDAAVSGAPPSTGVAASQLETAARNVLQWVEAKHRSPVRDAVETGRMVQVRLHALAELADALSPAGHTKPSTLAQQVSRAQAEWDSWTPERRAAVQLEGRSAFNLYDAGQTRDVSKLKSAKEKP
jgi:hypothetical protein